MKAIGRPHFILMDDESFTCAFPVEENQALNDRLEAHGVYPNGPAWEEVFRAVFDSGRFEEEVFLDSEAEACILRFESAQGRTAFIEWFVAFCENEKNIESLLEEIDPDLIDN